MTDSNCFQYYPRILWFTGLSGAGNPPLRWQYNKRRTNKPFNTAIGMANCNNTGLRVPISSHNKSAITWADTGNRFGYAARCLTFQITNYANPAV
jgi:hypothetical protein